MCGVSEETGPKGILPQRHNTGESRLLKATCDDVMRTSSIPLLNATPRSRLLLLSLLLSVGGCAGAPVPRSWPEPVESSPVELGTRVYERHDPATDALLRRWHVTTGADGIQLLDGTDEGWWPDGSRRHDRSWALGEEAGVWQSWHPSGVLRSTASFEAESGTMRFWHPNGVLAAEGTHRGGTRVGAWTFWHESGAKQSEGSFSLNRREGAWNFWEEDGELSAAGMYAGGERVGEWYLRLEETESGPDQS